VGKTAEVRLGERNPTIFDLAGSKLTDLAANGVGCDSLKRGGRAVVVAMALLVIAIGMLVATASRAQTITLGNPVYDSAPCPKPHLPGRNPNPWIQIQPTAVDI